MAIGTGGSAHNGPGRVRVEFEADELLASNLDDWPVCGLDITVGWPLPIESSYDDFARRVSALDPGVYVYPIEQTHITVLTAVNFRHQMNPTPSSIRRVEEAAGPLGEFVELVSGEVKPFAIKIGTPVLGVRAAFLSISNPTGEIEMIRYAALSFCQRYGGVLSGVRAPSIIHSTFLRFRRPPEHPEEFASEFHEIGSQTDFGSGTIREVLIAFETKPYMREGKVAKAMSLNAA